MMFLVLFVVLSAAAVLTWMLQRPGEATLTPLIRCARLAIGIACGVAAMIGFSRFVWFVVLHGHSWRSPSVLIGQTVSVTLLAQAIVFLRRIVLGRPLALAMTLWCGALSLLALARAVHSIMRL